MQVPTFLSFLLFLKGRESVVYFVWDSGSNCVKIGVSDDPEDRLRGLQTANPSPLFLLAVIPGTEETETALHARFANLRVDASSEWFRPDQRFLWFIRRAASRNRIDMGDRSSENLSGRVVGAIQFLEDRFREKREWESTELSERARRAGVSKNALYAPEVQGLPIRKRTRTTPDGNRAWFWIANEEWPSTLEIVDA